MVASGFISYPRIAMNGDSGLSDNDGILSYGFPNDTNPLFDIFKKNIYIPLAIY